MDIILTSEQNDFVEKALDGNNILVDACIGSGKTTAIQHLCNMIPKEKSVLYLTYNKLLKIDARTKIQNDNITVTNYHGFAYDCLSKAGIFVGVSDLVQAFIKRKPSIPKFEVLIIDEYQDIDQELSELLELIKIRNPAMQIIAVGDMQQKIYDKTTLDVVYFIDRFLGVHLRLRFTKCFRLNPDHAARLGKIWNKQIVGVNNDSVVEAMSVPKVCQFLANQNPEDVLCLGARTGDMVKVLNFIETTYPEKYNKNSVYASITDNDAQSTFDPQAKAAIFTTYDSSKGLERKICVLFDFTQEYWDKRLKQPLQSYEILRNIFCVAASRGKDRIIIVSGNDSLISEETLATPTMNRKKLRKVGISEMFDFKYKEDVEKCFALLSIKKVTSLPQSTISIKTNDALIDLSPCIGIYQEASFFKNYDIEKDISAYMQVHKMPPAVYSDSIRKSSVESKVLFLTSLETKQKRYTQQVEIPFISDSEKRRLHERLSSIFTEDEEVQTECTLSFTQDPSQPFLAVGRSDVIKNRVVYELKYVSELTHEHFLQCACYVVAHKLNKGILWNTRDNSMYEISIVEKAAFLRAVCNTVLKKKDETGEGDNNSSSCVSQKDYFEKEVEKGVCYFAVIDTETTWSDSVMSLGLVIAKQSNYKTVLTRYYLFSPEIREGGMFSGCLRIPEAGEPIECSRKKALEDVLSILQKYGVVDIFAYNAPFDQRHLPELQQYNWVDIMKFAAYKQYNKKIPNSAEVYSTGRLKRNYNVAAIMRMLAPDKFYSEKHNALLDARDELRIVECLGLSYNVYVKTEKSTNRVDEKAVSSFSKKTRNHNLTNIQNDIKAPAVNLEEPAKRFTKEGETVGHIVKSDNLEKSVEETRRTGESVENNIKNSFLSLYERVDAICCNMFSGSAVYNEKGVELFGLTAYIELMKQTPPEEYSFFGWKDECERLDQLRFLRNHILQGDSSIQCKQEDVAYLGNFYEQIMNRTDPLSLPKVKAKRRNDSAYAGKRVATREAPIPDDELVGSASADPELIFADAAADLLKVSKSTVYNLIKQGEISATKIKGKYYISKYSIEHYINRKKKLQTYAGLAVFVLVLLFLIMWILLL